MGRLRAAVVLAVALAGVLMNGSPATAGNWAVTTLDPLPERIEVNRAYTVGFWVLQHGFHPYSGGKLDPVGLKLVDDTGAATTFAGVALPEPAHYAAAVIVPRAGVWRLYGVQGPFEDHLVGTLTVPGGLTTAPVPGSERIGADEDPWGAIRPPQVAVDGDRDPPVATAAAGATGDPLAIRRAAGETVATGGSFPATPVGLALVAVAVLFALVLTHDARRSATRRPVSGSG